MTGSSRTLLNQRKAQLAYMVAAVLSFVFLSGLWAYIWVH